MCQNPDGSYTRKVYSGRHNFTASDGSWTPIDTDVTRQSDGRWHENANSLGVDYAGSADDAALTSVRLDGSHAIAYGLQGAAKVTPTVSGPTVTYPGVLSGTDVSLTTTATGVKESLVLHSAKVATSWVFPLHLQGLTARRESDGSVSFVDSSGAVQAVVPPGSMSDAKPGKPAVSQAVAYQVTTVGGEPALALSVDSVWLSDPARVFPVTVDPTVSSTNSSSSTFADSASGVDNSASSLLKVGTRDGSEKANSFLQFSTFAADYNGASITSVSLNLFDVWAASCSATAFTVNPVTQVWTPSGVTSYPGPSFGATAIGTLSQAPGAACTNTGLDPKIGAWMSVGLSTGTFVSWAKGGDNYGLALTASQTDQTAWKQFASTTSAHVPYLQVTYTGNVTPVVDGQSPANNATVWTLQPTLVAAAHDPDKAPSPLTYSFALYDAATPTTVLASRPWGAPSVWAVPANVLVVGRSYLWFAQVFDGAAYSTIQVYTFRVEAPQPPITSHLSQNSDNGLDPSIGNYTTSATDANVLTAGPPLQIQRDYNSKDPRVTGAFGAGWSSALDAKVVEHQDPQSSLFYVVVTYPDGQEVSFGRAVDGSFKPPTGRYATFAAASPGYTLTDKNQTVYTFGQPLTPGCTAATCQYGISSITDANKRAITFAYNGTHVATVSSGVSGRALHVSWTTPTAYTGDQLTKVCPPTSSTACSGYTYQSASRYANTVLDLGPRSYWRLGESSGIVANSLVLANNGADAATYHNVTLGAAGPFPGSTGATFDVPDGQNSYVDLTQGGVVSKELFNDSMPMTISLWFKTTDLEAPLVTFSQDPISKGSTTASGLDPALYIGDSGKLHAEFWTPSGTAPITTANPVNDGNWHHVALAYNASSGGVQTLYLDGAVVGTFPGTVSIGGAPYEYLGAGYLGGPWPDESFQNQTPVPTYFQGTMADVAYFTTALDAAAVSAMYNAGHASGQLLSG
ncbi:MAG: LamG domain-containing protein, partial [Actinobacteria bacterium]